MLDYAAAYYRKGVDGDTYAPSKVGIGMSVAAKKSNPDSLQRLKEWQENNKDPYRFSLEDIILATNNFSHENCIGVGGFGRVYKGELANVRGNGHYPIVAKRLDRSLGQGETQFYNELQILTKYVHNNIISFVGYCNETDENILVYEYASRGSLDKYLNDVSLTWLDRLKICINAAKGLNYLHGGSHCQGRIIHGDIKSANILLSDDWKAKIGVFGLSKLGIRNQDEDYVIDHVCGTRGYLDPLYLKSGSFKKKKSDIYSFGVVLFEILSGRLAFDHQKGQYLHSFNKHMFAEGKQNEVVFEATKKKISTFVNVAHQCLHFDREKRPTTKEVLSQLKKALEFQESALDVMHFASTNHLGNVNMQKVNIGQNIAWSFGTSCCCGLLELKFSKRNWTKMTQLSFIDKDRDRAGKDRDRGQERNDRERDSNCYVNNLAGGGTRKLGLGEDGFGKVDYLNFSERNWTEMTLLFFIGLILLAAPTCSATAGSWSGDPDDEGLISLADHKNIFQVVPGDVKNVWNEWVLRGLILISLISQIALCLLGYIRKYNWRTPVRMGLWCTCLLAYSVVPAALGMITQSNSEPTPPVAQPHRLNTSELMSFWAPFLFLHVGGPDSITAFALEDSELYLRYFVEMVFLSVVALYILLQSWPGYSYLPQLSILVYLAGFVKCSERIQALRLANTGYLRNSMLSPPDPGPNYHKLLEDFRLKKSQGFNVEVEEVPETPLPANDHSYPEEGKEISEAYDLFQTFKRLFVDLILTFEDRDGSQSYFRHLKPDDAFRVVEIELGFAFDMLYTKANVVYTFYGLLLRLLSIIFLLMVPVGFYSVCAMDDYHLIDVVITYLLIGTAIFMEIIAVVTMLRSDWTDHWLSQRNLTRKILIFPFFKKLTKQRWSGSIAQFDLLSVALEEKPASFLKIQEFIGIDNIRVKHCYKTYSKVSEDLKDLIYSQFHEFMVLNSYPKALCTHKGSFSLRKNECDALLWSITKVEFDQSILIWHIATTLCFSEEDNQDGADIDVCRTESKHISDYLLYLLVSYPVMLPIGIGMIRYRDTCAEAKRFFNEKGFITEKVEACRKLLEVDCMEVLPSKVKGDRCKSILFDGCRLALTLKKMKREHMWRVMSQVWIEILGYAATHCRGIHHKQHLGKGGEFLTHVWLLMAHLGITEQFQEFQGHSRAKINVW